MLMIGFVPSLWLAGFGFLMRAALMNMSAPLYSAFCMEQTPEHQQGLCEQRAERGMADRLGSGTVYLRRSTGTFWIFPALHHNHDFIFDRSRRHVEAFHRTENVSHPEVGACKRIYENPQLVTGDFCFAGLLSFSRWNFAKKCKYGMIELLRSLQRREMAHARKKDVFCVWNVVGKIFSMFAVDEFIILAMDDGNRHADPRQIVCRIIRLSPLHESHGIGELIEFIRRG